MQRSSGHKVTFEAIRRLTIECFALASSAHALLGDGDRDESTIRTRVLYEELFSERFLQLAICIRTKFYQDTDHRRTSGFMEQTGELFKWVKGQDESAHPYTLKDVCDKIIHANSVFIEPGEASDFSFVALYGEHRVAGETQGWAMNIFPIPLCEGILGWLDAIEDE